MNVIDDFKKVGSSWFFEYHCEESYNSIDAQLWYRSHQKVTILSCDNADEFGDLNLTERVENGTPLVYKIKFDDGFEGSAFEDELLISPDDYCRPDPPTNADKVVTEN